MSAGNGQECIGIKSLKCDYDRKGVNGNGEQIILCLCGIN